MGALASRRFLDGGAGVGVGPPAGHAVASNGADQGGGAPCHRGKPVTKIRSPESLTVGGAGSSG
jgi:hypothetical protein